MSENLSIIHDDKPAAVNSTTSLGTRGEAMAAQYLITRGLRIVVSNFKVPVGRNSKGVSVTDETCGGRGDAALKPTARMAISVNQCG